MLITGIMINYFYICKRKLWFHLRRISLEQSSELVLQGKIETKVHYKQQKKKEIEIDNKIKMDFIDSDNIVHESKRSMKFSKAHKMQLGYYLLILKEKGIETSGIINYPRQRRKEKVELSEEMESELRTTINAIKQINDLEKPPEESMKGKCKRCSFYELCFI